MSSSGTLPSLDLLARPSTTAVLPTPGSPMSTGSFFVRRERMLRARVDLLLAPDDGVEPPLARHRRQVARKLRERFRACRPVSRAARRPHSCAPSGSSRAQCGHKAASCPRPRGAAGARPCSRRRAACPAADAPMSIRGSLNRSASSPPSLRRSARAASIPGRSKVRFAPSYRTRDERARFLLLHARCAQRAARASSSSRSIASSRCSQPTYPCPSSSAAACALRSICSALALNLLSRKVFPPVRSI